MHHRMAGRSAAADTNAPALNTVPAGPHRAADMSATDRAIVMTALTQTAVDSEATVIEITAAMPARSEAAPTAAPAVITGRRGTAEMPTAVNALSAATPRCPRRMSMDGSVRAICAAADEARAGDIPGAGTASANGGDSAEVLLTCAGDMVDSFREKKRYQ